nr:E3 ubiquitin-protein ligase synoviolin-like [Dermacentor andersoni]
MEYQVADTSISPAELEADSRWVRAVKARRAAAAHQPVVSPPPASPPSKTACTTTLRRHARLPRLPAEDFKIVYRPGGGLDLRTTTNGALLQTLCTRATIDYASARTADRVRINPYNNSLTVSTPSEPRARLYLRVSELRLGAISYPLRAYMAAPDNALRGIIHNAVDSQTQDEIVQDLQSMNVSTPYAIADARQMGRSQSILITFVGTSTLPSTIVFNCGVYRCHPFRPRAEACTNCWAPGHRADGAHVTGSRSCGLRFERNGPSSPPVTSKHQPPPPAPPTVPILKTPRPSRPRHHSVSRGPRRPPPPPPPVSWKPQPPTSDPQTAALEATIAAQQLQIQELSRQLQAALVRLSSPAPPPTSPAPAPPQPPSLAVESMNTASSAASSRASSPNRSPPLKRRSPSSDPVAPERDVIRQTTSFLQAFEKRVMARFARLEERVASIDTRVAAIESHLTALNTRVAALETRQSATEATVAHLSLPAPLTPAPTPTLSGDSAIHHGQTPHAP